MAGSTKQFRVIDIKSGGEEEPGTFTGLLSPYGNVDAGDDVVCKGAFTKTLSDNRGRVPLLWSHKEDTPIGTLELTDTPEGLTVKGRLLLDLQKAKEAYSLLQNDVISGLSIGFKAIKKDFVEGKRLLKEVKLYEGSLVVFPMNELARVDSVKSMSDGADFMEELDEAQTACAGWQIMSTLENCVMSTWWSAGYDATGRLAEDIPALLSYAGSCFDQAKDAYLAALAKYGAQTAGIEADTAKSIMLGAKASMLEKKAGAKPKPAPEVADPETKVGRKVSADTKDSMKTAAGHMSAAMESMKSATELLAPLYADGADEVTPANAAGAKSDEPESVPLDLIAELKSLLSVQ